MESKGEFENALSAFQALSTKSKEVIPTEMSKEAMDRVNAYMMQVSTIINSEETADYSNAWNTFQEEYVRLSPEERGDMHHAILNAYGFLKASVMGPFATEDSVTQEHKELLLRAEEMLKWSEKQLGGLN